jgi:hypothetical protein
VLYNPSDYTFSIFKLFFKNKFSTTFYMNIVHHKPWFCTKKMKQIGNRKNNCPLLSMCKYDISKILSQYIFCIAYMTNEGRDIRILGPSWSWSYGSWIYDYLCNQCLSPLTLCVRIPLGVKFVGDLWEVGGFLRVLLFPPPIKLSATI